MIFVFLGEFGYELLNWQGQVRKISNENNANTIVAVSRESCAVLYKDCDFFICLEEYSLWRKSRADGYFARCLDNTRDGFLDYACAGILKWEIRLKIFLKLTLQYKVYGFPKFYFSSNLNYISGIQFGCPRTFYRSSNQSIRFNSDIYKTKGKNLGTYMLPKLTNSKVDIPFEKFILVMAATRKSHKIDEVSIQISEIIDTLLITANVILLNFESKREYDTQPVNEIGIIAFKQRNNFKEVSCTSLLDEMTYIEAAQLCLFITEGDLRSHTYLPPLLGRNVIVVCSASLQSKVPYVLEWNKSLFTDSGKMHMVTPKDVTINKVNKLIKDYGY